MIRLQKYLAMQTGLSRRKADELVERGLVLVNGKKAVPGQKIDPDKDDIVMKDQEITPSKRELVYLAMNKPAGVLCTREDTHGRKTIIDLLDAKYKHLYPIGRLDKDSEGLILLTNDGDFAHKISHPSFVCPKKYLVKSKGLWSKEQLEKLQKKMNIDGESYQAVDVEHLLQTPDASHDIFTLREGKKRQIRIICEHFGHPVISLKRIAIGKITLNDLKKGSYRPLTPPEIASF